jgi:EAL domain-containing protein (putative c-di-GMP-specific phosphodiesterase class I)
MAHKLNISVIAEGVKMALHLELKQSIGCDFAKRYYLSRPITAVRYCQHCGRQYREANYHFVLNNFKLILHLIHVITHR